MGDTHLVEGVVAKNLRLRWRGGERLHVKVKRRRTLITLCPAANGIA